MKITNKGLVKVKDLYLQRDRRVKELKAEGKKIIGYLCCFAPPELITAAGMVPYRIMGKMGESISEADNYIEAIGCPYVRNCFDQALKGRMNYLDGLVVSHSCDMVQRVYGPWKKETKIAYSYMFSVPHIVSPHSQDFFRRELGFFRKSLEKFGGKQITDGQIKEAVALYNTNRSLVRELYAMRKDDIPPISGTEMLQLLIVGMSIPADEFNSLLMEVLAEAKGRKAAPQGKRPPRLMIWGSILDDITLVEMIEKRGAQVVTDDTCIGTRCFNEDVVLTDDVNQGLMERYFRDFNCPRTYREAGVRRFDYILKTINDYRVQGVVGYVIAFCDIHKLDRPDLKDLLAEKNCPMLLISDDYTLGNKEAVGNRLDAFLEMLS